MIYSESYLSYFCQKANSEPESTKRYRLLLCLISVTIININWWRAEDLDTYLTFFTHWSLTLGAFFLVYRCIVQRKALKPSSASVKSLALLSEISLTSNLAVVVIYWPLLHAKNIQRPEIYLRPITHAMTYVNHLVPFLTLLSNFIISEEAVMFP